MMTRLAILIVAMGAIASLAAVRQSPFEQKRFVTTQSRSGQFTVQGLPSSRPFAGVMTGSNVTYVRMDPATFSMTAENIKGAVLATLATTDNWQSPIAVSLHPVRRDGEDIVITSVRSASGWDYR